MFKKYCLIFLFILSFLYRIEFFSGRKEIPTILAFSRCSQKHSQEPLNPVEPVIIIFLFLYIDNILFIN